MQNPLFSVVIPTYNSYQKLVRAVESLQEQSYQNFEVLIIDDGSTDETKSKITTLLSAQIHYFYKTNGGPASARNLGITKAKGEYVCFLDADDTFAKEKLLLYSKFCEKGVPFIFSDALYIQESNNSSNLFSSKRYIKHTSFFESLLVTNFIVASTVCVKKEVLEKVAFFDESVGLKFVEDYDLWLKIARRYPLSYIEPPLTNYYVHESNNSHNVQRTVLSLLRIYKKWIFVSPIAVQNFVKYTLVWCFYLLGIKK